MTSDDESVPAMYIITKVPFRDTLTGHPAAPVKVSDIFPEGSEGLSRIDLDSVPSDPIFILDRATAALGYEALVLAYNAARLSQRANGTDQL